MFIFFELGAEYERSDLLDYIGSKQDQSGIIWGNRVSNCLIVTTGGKHAASAGYSDRRNQDGSWYYIGQGAIGDQLVDKYANALLVGQERNILLFSTREPNAKEFIERGNRRKFYRYEGMFDAISWKFITPTIGKRKRDKLIQVCLYPVANIYSHETRLNAIGPATARDLNKMKAEIKGQPDKMGKRLTVTEYQLRSLQIKNYALARANGICEWCNKEAPFITMANAPFLEVHHILKLADDGPDTCENVAALCPNCHREAHFGLNKDKIKEELMAIVFEKEKY